MAIITRLTERVDALEADVVELRKLINEAQTTAPAGDGDAETAKPATGGRKPKTGD